MSEGQPKQPAVCPQCGGTNTGTKEGGLSMCYPCGVFWGGRAAADDSAQPPTEDETRVRLQRAGSPSLTKRVEKAECEALCWMLEAREAGDLKLQLAIGKTGTALVELIVLLDARQKETENAGLHQRAEDAPPQ